MNGTSIRFRPLLETLDGKLLPGGASGGVLRAGIGDIGVPAVVVVAPPTSGMVAIGENDGQSHPVNPSGGMPGGVLRGEVPGASVTRCAGEEIPQTT